MVSQDYPQLLAYLGKPLRDVINDENEIFNHLGEQIHVESKIVDQKFRSVQNALMYFGLSTIIVLITIGTWIIKLSA